jgi:mono/diheme cytochrome c family protein
MKKILLSLLAGIVILVLGLVAFVSLTWNKTFDAPYPDITASTDSTMIARGKYLAFGPSHCATCHVPMDKILDVEHGQEMPLIGGWQLDIPPGIFRAPNITPDEETGIGKLSDAEIARVLRYGVGHDGRFIFPFMPYENLSDEDLTAVISFLRSQEPVANQVAKTEYSFLGKALMAFGLFQPVSPAQDPPSSVAKDTTALYGKYLTHDVANCYGCHTNRDLQTGEFIGEPFAGGLKFEPDELSQGYAFITPNLTPDPETGAIADWSQKTFINRFRMGRTHKGTHMPWGAYSRMDDNDLKAIYNYLQSLPPVTNHIPKTTFAPGEPLPKN